jgi:hypothetical protein
MLSPFHYANPFCDKFFRKSHPRALMQVLFNEEIVQLNEINTANVFSGKKDKPTKALAGSFC